VAELWELTASEIARQVRARTVSPTEVVRAHLDQIARVDPTILAWETVDREGALAAARQLESSAEDLPLKGVPVGVKDIFLTGGLRTTANFPPFRDFVPDVEAEAVSRLRHAGAIVLGKTVTVQFALQDPPATRNPYNLARTPGGSSSGSAAAVASRTVPLALGTQTAGSVLRPSAYCGVVGLKPTYGRVSKRNVFPLSWSFDHVGAISRSVEDCALALQVLAGHDPADPSSSREPAGDYAGAVQRGLGKPPRLGLIRDFFDISQPEVREHVSGVAAKLEAAGAELVELRLPRPLEIVGAAASVIMSAEVAAVHTQLLAREPDGYFPFLKAAVQVGQLIPAASYLQAQRLRRRFRNEIAELLPRVDAFFTPTVVNVAPTRETTGDSSLQAPWSQTGLPSITLPSGLSRDGLPLAVQLAGSWFREEALLAIAAWVEARRDPLPTP
jgi:aspartyl-tRNA(Asn)/glutamyl-tRNA(Gln) amidotransferase subunit A